MRVDPYAALRLFCFPYAGGRAAIYCAWSDGLPSAVDVCPIELPGHGTRFREAPFARLAPLVASIVDALTPLVGHPFAFFGHSMGTLVCFETARELRRRGLSLPVHLFLSGGGAPDAPRRRCTLNDLPAPALIEALRLFDGAHPELLAHDDLMRAMLPVLRADFAVCETYGYVSEEPLACPITAFGGLGDRHVERSQLEAWRTHTRASFELRMLPGNHFFIQTAQGRLWRLLARELLPLSRGVAHGITPDDDRESVGTLGGNSHAST